MFENIIVNGDIYATRIIASWLRAGGKLHYLKDYKNFEIWLRIIEINESDIQKIMNLATNGKLEYELSAKEYIKTFNI